MDYFNFSSFAGLQIHPGNLKLPLEFWAKLPLD
jgi:hypothetical protein